VPHFNDQQALDFLRTVFENMLDPAAPAEDLKAYFADEYHQEADGVHLDLEGFLAHAKTLKGQLVSAEVIFEKVAVSGPTIADIHIVNGVKQDGSTVQAKVIAFYTISEGKITAVDELTRIVKGSAEDRDLGHRTR
jgi:predicted SnoaL-like aldol condensation-catalyzing enzyme